MRGKKAKAIRNIVKSNLGVDKIEAEYDTRLQEEIVFLGGELVKKQTHVSTLKDGTSRKVYKDAKQTIKTAA